ncbi:N-acetyltransferase [Methanospirillum stamsii]|uniref:N-acetyltransferase n=2 Tax=Methanospirillum stamsii TaxID=1277351 RepID=A0A2V2N223_9EURY|nr:acyltransferase [Methanospirillum stamsii]PWR69501.1 N-acetyltransferase [Methanospirillum stamsii]
MAQFGINIIGNNVKIFDSVYLGFPPRYYLDQIDFPGCIIGDNAVIRPGTTIYADVKIGDSFSSGHNVMIREKTIIGKQVSIGSGAIIEGYSEIGDYCNLQSLVYIPTNTCLGSHVFIGPNSVLTNDKYPPNGGEDLHGPVLEDYVSIGANTTILPGVTIGNGSLVAAGSVVTKDVPPDTLAIGSPARFKPLPSGAKRR